MTSCPFPFATFPSAFSPQPPDRIPQQCLKRDYGSYTGPEGLAAVASLDFTAAERKNRKLAGINSNLDDPRNNSKSSLGSICHQFVKTAAQELDHIAPGIFEVQRSFSVELDRLPDSFSAILDDLLSQGVWIGDRDGDMEKSSACILKLLGFRVVWIDKLEDLESHAITRAQVGHLHLLQRGAIDSEDGRVWLEVAIRLRVGSNATEPQDVDVP